ncbi:MAG TPA: hypothetical protein VMV91_08130 [Rhodocyclaceae bacterium]|nr:hypothetical protein [Rhodocyclaceae bacterium]
MSGDFDSLYAGRLWSVMSWDGLAAFWARIDPTSPWYLYAVGEPPPTAPAAAAEIAEFLRRIDELLRREHHESYCGIVYADDLERPSFVKIYDPGHLGSSCGSGKHPPLPGWIMSPVPPSDLQAARPAPEGRRRWWRALFPGTAPAAEQ